MRVALGLLVIVGCEPEAPGERTPVGGEGPRDICFEEVRTTVPREDAMLEGRNLDDLAAWFDGPHTYSASWWDGRTEAVTLEVELFSDDVMVVDYPRGDPACFRHLRTDARFALTSADGALSETWVQQLYWSAPWTDVDFSLQAPIADLGGTVDPASLAPNASQVIGWFRIAQPGSPNPDEGYVELSTPTPGDPSGSEERRDRICEW